MMNPKKFGSDGSNNKNNDDVSIRKVSDTAAISTTSTSSSGLLSFFSLPGPLSTVCVFTTVPTIVSSIFLPLIAFRKGDLQEPNVLLSDLQAIPEYGRVFMCCWVVLMCGYVAIFQGQSDYLRMKISENRKWYNYNCLNNTTKADNSTGTNSKYSSLIFKAVGNLEHDEDTTSTLVTTTQQIQQAADFVVKIQCWLALPGTILLVMFDFREDSMKSIDTSSIAELLLNTAEILNSRESSSIVDTTSFFYTSWDFLNWFLHCTGAAMIFIAAGIASIISIVYIDGRICSLHKKLRGMVVLLSSAGGDINNYSVDEAINKITDDTNTISMSSSNFPVLVPEDVLKTRSVCFSLVVITVVFAAVSRCLCLSTSRDDDDDGGRVMIYSYMLLLGEVGIGVFGPAAVLFGFGPICVECDTSSTTSRILDRKKQH